MIDIIGGINTKLKNVVRLIFKNEEYTFSLPISDRVKNPESKTRRTELITENSNPKTFVSGTFKRSKLMRMIMNRYIRR